MRKAAHLAPVLKPGRTTLGILLYREARLRQIMGNLGKFKFS